MGIGWRSHRIQAGFVAVVEEEVDALVTGVVEAEDESACDAASELACVVVG